MSGDAPYDEALTLRDLQPLPTKGILRWMTDPIDVANALEKATGVFERHPELAVVYFFGSFARGDYNQESDVDLGIVYRDRHTQREAHERIATQIASDVAQATGIERVDVVDLEAQGPIFCHGVLCEGRRLYTADRARRVDFESETFVRAIDFRPTYELATRGKTSALRHWLREHHDVGASAVEAGRPQGKSR